MSRLTLLNHLYSSESAHSCSSLSYDRVVEWVFWWGVEKFGLWAVGRRAAQSLTGNGLATFSSTVNLSCRDQRVSNESGDQFVLFRISSFAFLIEV